MKPSSLLIELTLNCSLIKLKCRAYRFAAYAGVTGADLNAVCHTSIFTRMMYTVLYFALDLVTVIVHIQSPFRLSPSILKKRFLFIIVITPRLIIPYKFFQERGFSFVTVRNRRYAFINRQK